MSLVSRFLRDEAGATAIEYGLIAAGISIAIIAVVAGLGTKLTSSHSVPDALEAYQKFVAQRMQMAAEDGRQLFEECQRITQKITRSLSSNWPSGIANRAARFYGVRGTKRRCGVFGGNLAVPLARRSPSSLPSLWPHSRP